MSNWTHRTAQPADTVGAPAKPTGYPCPELGRAPGVTADRFTAFAPPSRVGNWLHFPDGRRERFPA